MIYDGWQVLGSSGLQGRGLGPLEDIALVVSVFPNCPRGGARGYSVSSACGGGDGEVLERSATTCKSLPAGDNLD